MDTFDFKSPAPVQIKNESYDDVASVSTSSQAQNPTGSPSQPNASLDAASSQPSHPNTLLGCSLSADGLSKSAQAQRPRHVAVTEESAIVSVLVHVRDPTVTEAAVALVLRWARETAAPSNGGDLGVAYIQKVIVTLDEHGVASDRRAVVTGMLTRRLQEQLETLRSRIETISTPQPSKAATATRKPSELKSGRRTALGSRGVQTAARTADANDGQRKHKRIRVSEQPETSDFSSEDDVSEMAASRSKNISSTHSSVTSTFKENEATSAVAKIPTSAISTASEKKATMPRSALGVFLECALAARQFKPGENADETAFRKHVHSVWRKIPKESADKAQWQELFRIRRTSTDVSSRSRKLLECQGLLANFVPDYHIFAAVPPVDKPQAPSGDRGALKTPVHSIYAVSSPSPASRGKLTQPQHEHTSGSAATSITSRPIGSHNGKSDNLPLSDIFPRMQPATSDTLKTQACYVPFAGRLGSDPAVIFVLDTPDTPTGPMTEACVRARLNHRDVIDVKRRNDNIFAATFADWRPTQRLLDRPAFSFPRLTATGVSSQSCVYAEVEFHLFWPPRVFVCDTEHINVQHSIAAQRLSESLQGTKRSYELFVQNVAPKPIRYILRFSSQEPEPLVQQFHLPLDGRDGKVWGVFRPLNKSVDCIYCSQRCQSGAENSCKFAFRIAKW